MQTSFRDLVSVFEPMPLHGLRDGSIHETLRAAGAAHFALHLEF